MSETALRARGISKQLGRRVVLEGVDFELRRAQISILLGANGAGKTTLLRILAGLSLPSAGTLETESSTERTRGRSAIGYLGHDTMLYDALSAEENLLFATRLHGCGAERVEPLLAAAGLQHVADQKAGSFSRGMRQRLALARAQVHDPPILLLDEPWNALDPSAAEALAAALGGLRDAGTALCVVTHDLERVAQLADSAWVLRAGRCERLPGSSFEHDSLRRALEAGG